MYPHFIELHTAENGSYDYVGKKRRTEKICINIDKIVMFYPDNTSNEGGTILAFDEVETTGAYQDVVEGYADVKDLIRSSGCAIQKADPRLDGTIPLTMDDLCKLEMIGEPVWNSNTRHWMLVIDSDSMHKTVDLVDNCGKIIRFEPHDVSKFPLYRMKQTGQSAREYIEKCMRERKDG